MVLHVHNTLTGKKEPFKPIKKGKVGMYLCGPTVYDHGHLGHGRSAVAFDVIRRYLEYVYGDVTFVTNYTDIDDKMIDRAALEKITVEELAKKIIPEYESDYAALGIKPPTVQTKATDYIPQMVELIQKLIDRGHAYELDDGVYFDISAFKEYGKLSGQKQEELRAGARVESDSRKRHPHDFVLWKKEKPGEPSWESPWGKGRPGWHIECSAMSRTELGQPFDIHGGGMDLMFPHHECEIAQSESAYGTAFCTTWLHNGFITVNKEKMSKSLGNFSTLKQIFEQFPPRVVRYFYLTAHYRSPIEFSPELLSQAQNALERIGDFWIKLMHNTATTTKPHKELESKLTELAAEFESAMDDDFDTPGALAALFSFIKHINIELAEGILSKEETEKIQKALKKIDTVLNILPNKDTPSLDSELAALIQERETARAKKEWAKSDELRDQLEKRGILLKDTQDGTIWKWK